MHPPRSLSMSVSPPSPSRGHGPWLPLAAWLLGLLLWLAPAAVAPAHAFDNPDLLPDHPTPVIDLARALTDGQRASLEGELTDFERNSGWKLRVLTQYDRTPGVAV